MFTKRSKLAISLMGVLSVASIPANAGMTIPVNFTVSDSIHDFPQETLNFWQALGIKARVKGTTTALDLPVLADNSSSFNFPVTDIVIGSWFKITAGRATGSAISYSRINKEGKPIQLLLANFSIDYKHKKIVADATFSNKTVPQLAIFDFNIAESRALHYKFPFTFSLDDKIDNLKLTPASKAVYKEALELPESAYPYLDNSFGTLTNKSYMKLRFPTIPRHKYQENE